MNYKLAIVVPWYKEEGVLAETPKRLTKLLDDLIRDNQISDDSFILLKSATALIR